jgi:hypothetical protein
MSLDEFGLTDSSGAPDLKRATIVLKASGHYKRSARRANLWSGFTPRLTTLTAVGLCLLFAHTRSAAADGENQDDAPPSSSEGTSSYAPYAPDARICYTCGATLSTGYYHTCGIQENNTMLCWGSNKENQSQIPRQYVRFESWPNTTELSRRAAIAVESRALAQNAPFDMLDLDRDGFISRVEATVTPVIRDLETRVVVTNFQIEEEKPDPGPISLSQFELYDVNRDMKLSREEYTPDSGDTFVNTSTWSILYDFHKQIPELDPNTGLVRMLLFNFSDPELGFTVENFTWVDIAGWKVVSCGYTHTCGITTSDVLLCWGQGKNKQSLLPQWIMAATDIKWRQVSTGTGHTCAITINGSAACWGANDEGQIDIPQGVDNWTSISCGYAHTCGVSANGSGYCWGWNGVNPGGMVPYGQCRVPNTHYNNHTWRHISAGFVHSCGVDSLGVGHCWGAGGNGQLEAPTIFETADSQAEIVTPYNHAPTRVPARWNIIEASYYHSCGLTINGSVFCW